MLDGLAEVSLIIRRFVDLREHLFTVVQACAHARPLRVSLNVHGWRVECQAKWFAKVWYDVSDGITEQVVDCSGKHDRWGSVQIRDVVTRGPSVAIRNA